MHDLENLFEFNLCKVLSYQWFAFFSLTSVLCLGSEMKQWCLYKIYDSLLFLPHSTQRKDPYYKMAEGAVIISDLTSHPHTHPPSPTHLPTKQATVEIDCIQILNLDLVDQSNVFK